MSRRGALVAAPVGPGAGERPEDAWCLFFAHLSHIIAHWRCQKLKTRCPLPITVARSVAWQGAPVESSGLYEKSTVTLKRETLFYV